MSEPDAPQKPPAPPRKRGVRPTHIVAGIGVALVAPTRSSRKALVPDPASRSTRWVAASSRRVTGSRRVAHEWPGGAMSTSSSVHTVAEDSCGGTSGVSTKPRATSRLFTAAMTSREFITRSLVLMRGSTS